MTTTVATPGDLKKIREEIAQVAAAMAKAQTEANQAAEARLKLVESALKEVVDSVLSNMMQDADLAEKVETLERRIAALEGGPTTTTSTTPVPPTTTTTTTKPVPTGSSFANMKLIGGFRLSGEFARGEIAVDEEKKLIYQTGHAQRNEVYVYEYTSPGVGPDINAWPILAIKETLPAWWDTNEGYANGIAIDENGELWAAPRKFYDTSPPKTLRIYGRNSGVIKTINLPRQQYAGFLTSWRGRLTHLAGGGYESGQGSAFGPTLATMEGEGKINYNFNAAWEARCPREPNYFSLDGKDGWVCVNPRRNPETGVLEGRWACDRIYGGGIELDDGYYFFAHCAVGAVDYAVQSSTFDVDGVLSTYVFRFDRDYKLQGWTLLPEVESCPVIGQDVGDSGKVYLAQGNAWKGGLYKVDTAVRIYQ